jgi:Domain of unknown function (DUF4158)
MPGTFLTAKERERLASFPEDIPHWDLITSFTLTDEDHTFIQTYRNDPHRLGVALQLPVFSANNPPAHVRERGQKSLPGAGLRAGGGG